MLKATWRIGARWPSSRPKAIRPRLLSIVSADPPPPADTPTSGAETTSSNTSNTSNTSPTTSSTTSASPVEIKDEARFLFNAAWRKVSQESPRMHLPHEIIWLMGAPGSGKGTCSPAICRARSITNPPISISRLLKSDHLSLAGSDTKKGGDLKQQLDRGEMVDDGQVVELLLRALLNSPDVSSGVLVDGFPRTGVQVETLKLLYDKMQLQQTTHAGTALAIYYPRPVFRMTVLYVDEQESLRRQLRRGQLVRDHNLLVTQSGGQQGQLIPERVTDSDELLIRARYKVFQQHISSIMRLKKLFPFHLINAVGSIDEVVRRIGQEFEYQSSLELDEQTFNAIQQIPLADSIGVHSRQELIRRLESCDKREMGQCVQVIEKIFVPAIKRHGISGTANIRIDNRDLHDGQRAVDIIMDVLSERGYRVSVEYRRLAVPVRVDRETFEIVCDVQGVWIFHLRFPSHQIRGVFGGDDGGREFGPTASVEETEG